MRITSQSVYRIPLDRWSRCICLLIVLRSAARRFVLARPPTHLNGAALHHDEAVVHPAGGQHDQRLRPRRPHPERDGRRAPRVRQRQRRVRRPVKGG